MNKKFNLLATVILSCVSCLPALAAVSPEQADHLGKDLTPMGAERAGNAAGTIPEWRPLSGIPEGIARKPGDFYPDPFTDDKPLFEITTDNLEQYRDNLTTGQLALFAKYPDSFRMPVYQTRRTAAQPEWVYENVRKNAVTAQLAQDGNGISHAYGGVPFPIAQNGLEAIWNHNMRYAGSTIRVDYQGLTLQRNGKYTRNGGTAYQKLPYYDSDKDLRDSFGAASDYFIGLYLTTAPARKNGDVMVIRDPMNQTTNPRKGWLYIRIKNQVRRAPNIAYDTPNPATNGTTTFDELWMYNGAPNKYDWKLVGKKEIYIPYNNYPLDLPDSFDNLLGRDAKGKFATFINPDKSRWELHRVYVVEAILKEGENHLYAKRQFYIDEDSWIIAMTDNYDAEDNLWRTNMAHVVNRYDLPANVIFAITFIDLKDESMAVGDLHNEASEGYYFNEPINDRFFTSGNVRKLGRH